MAQAFKIMIMLTKEQMKGNIEAYRKLTLEDIEDALRSMFSKEDLKPYKELGNGLYELPGYVITDRVGLKKYLKESEK